MLESGSGSGSEITEITEILGSIFSKLTETIEEPSTIFITNLRDIYRAPKEECINHLRQVQQKTLNVLRNQLFYIFIDHFNEKTLTENQFTVSKMEEELDKHLKKRMKPLNLCYDIYSIGLSILEGKIVNKLAVELLKPAFVYQETPNPSHLLNNQHSQIVNKIHEMFTINNKILNENKEMRQHIIKLEMKIEHLSDLIKNPPHKSNHESTANANSYSIPAIIHNSQQIATNPTPSSSSSTTANTTPLYAEILSKRIDQNINKFHQPQQKKSNPPKNTNEDKNKTPKTLQQSLEENE